MKISGSIKFYNDEKGFGFIRCDNGDPDVFFHVTQLDASGIKSVNKDQGVLFNILEKKDGKIMAVDIELC